jgi:hypothetical protein
MAGVVETTNTFATNNVITSTAMNNIIDQTIFTEDALASGGTLALVAGKMKVATSGITSNEMAVNAVTTNTIADSAITNAKISASAAIDLSKLATGALPTAITIAFTNIATAAIGTKAELEASTASKLVAADLVKHSPPVAKAYGSFTIASSARTLSGSLNVSVSRLTSTTSQVTFTSALSSAAYTVIAQSIDSGTSPLVIDTNPTVYNKLTSGFKILHAGEADDRAIDFVVFGSTLA